MSRGPIIDLLEPYLKKIKPSGRNNIMALCPLPGHDESKPSFAINVDNGMWMCHGCGRKGGLATLLHLLRLPPRTVEAMLEPVQAQLERHKKQERRRYQNRFRHDPLLGGTILPEELLGVYDWKPLDLVEQGFNPKLLRELGVGYDKRKDRITFPLRDTYGNLIGIAGRATNRYDEPRYKVYSGGTYENGKQFDGDFGPEFDDQFHNYSIDSHDHLWNGHNVYADALLSGKAKPLFIVEGFKACIWLIQHGYPNTVALMGSFLTRRQFDLLCLLVTDTVVLLLDNDKAGQKATKTIGSWLRKTMKVEVCSYYPDWAEEPDALNKDGLTKTIEARERYALWQLHQD